MTLPKKKSADYSYLVSGITELLETARRATARSVNAIMTAAYWMIGRRMVEYEQGGKTRAEYGKALLERLSADLSNRYGRGFGVDNLQRFRSFYLAYPPDLIYATRSRNLGLSLRDEKYATLSRISQIESSEEAKEPIRRTTSAEFSLGDIASCFPLPWSSYVRLLSVKNENARTFYETEALRGGWSVRQLDRQIESQFYERTALSKNKAAMLRRGAKARPADKVAPEEEIKDPYILEFLGLKDEYSETDLEEALIRHLEFFLLELGGDFTFVARQKRLRVGDEWYRVDLVFFHRRLRCLLVIDLKLGKFTHSDVGQMHLYLNYARENWVLEDENPPVGLILCAQKDAAVAKYALENLRNKVLASEYKTVLPDEKIIAAELEHTRHLLDMRMGETLALASDKKRIKPR